ncbi:MAG TPA: aromatic ring-hydroxylating dioxygenase subunit alpha [Stellaceae bacterium]|jgi:5,5'-dehydrodivanillate O-demethylase|nr:aromatic ring-hydroxylating dioxygenase subunit alpha [Stellaceae bacterium]
MLSESENQLMTQVGPGTPGGEMLRRYWWPIEFSDHVKDRPMKVRLLGQDFVLFRNGQGKVGMLDLHCPHRLTSLEYGRVEDEGLRCCYHGWLFAPDGKCLDTPAERPESNFKDRVRANAYEVEELGGFVFVYIGPKPAPLLPKYDVLVRTDGKRVIGCDEDYCNWLQKAENGADLPHLPFLHASVYPRMAMKTPLGYDYEDTRYGFKCILKMPELPPRIIHFVMPAHSRISTTPRTGMLPSHDMRLRVPIDDTLTYSFWIRFHPLTDGKFEQQTLGFTGKQRDVYPREDDGYWNIPSNEQDRVAQETQGQITDRTIEHLAESDRGIVMLRRRLREDIDAVAAGRDPACVTRDPTDDAMIKFETTLKESEYVLEKV